MDVNTLKEKMVSDFEEWLYKASYGYLEDYSHILLEIDCIQAWNELDEGTIEYYLNL